MPSRPLTAAQLRRCSCSSGARPATPALASGHRRLVEHPEPVPPGKDERIRGEAVPPKVGGAPEAHLDGFGGALRLLVGKG